MTFQTLSHPMRWLFLAHALAGTVALLILLIPILSKKGGKTHVRTGWIYTAAMAFVGFSAFVITPWRAFFDPTRTPNTIGFAVFLFFIAVFTLCVLWFGLEALKHKNRKAPSRRLSHIAPPIFLLVCSFATQIIGILLKSPLLLIFPFIAIFNAKSHLSYWKNAPQEKMHWWYAHMSGMTTACIATITAFLVTALPRMVDHWIVHSPVLWIAPGMILGTLTRRWVSAYQKQFNEKG